MTFLEAALLGLVQGLTEFFPVSSSGHLLLMQKLLGFSNLEDYLNFDLACHGGTLVSLILVFRRDLWALARGSDKRAVAALLISLLPLIPLTLAIGPLKKMFHSTQYLGYFFLLTALFLYIGEHCRLKRPALATGASTAVRYRLLDALMIGVAQGAALLPGVSRSGATISAATYLGWSRQEAARFSFLMAIPTICGGMLLQAVEVLRGHDAPSPLSFSHYAIGACIAFVVGWLALSLLIKLSKGGTFKVFYWYCLLLGALTLFFASGR